MTPDVPQPASPPARPAEPPRVIILANKRKPLVVEALDGLRPWLTERAEVVAEPDINEFDRGAAEALGPLDLALVLGGDGTMLALARKLVDLAVPMLGVNFGKVGFLAEFNLQDLKKHWERVACRDCRMSHRMMIDVAVFPAGAPEWGGNGKPDAQAMPEPVFKAVAMNDAVITAGPPYRMIEIELAIEPRVSMTSATSFSGDGVIVSTPSGSTAYNLAAGGPIISPGIDGLCIAAICPQSLAFRPIVFSARCETWLAIHRANPGTTLVIDGQTSCKMEAGQQVRITKHPTALTLVHNPDLNYWKMLAHKMHWAARPRRGDGGPGS